MDNRRSTGTRRKAIGARDLPGRSPPPPAPTVAASAAPPAKVKLPPPPSVKRKSQPHELQAAQEGAAPKANKWEGFSAPPHVFFAFSVVVISSIVIGVSFLFSLNPYHRFLPYFPRGNWNRYPERHHRAPTSRPTEQDQQIIAEQSCEDFAWEPFGERDKAAALWYPDDRAYDVWAAVDAVKDKKQPFYLDSIWRSSEMREAPYPIVGGDGRARIGTCIKPTPKGEWHVERVGPFISRGGREWWQIGWHDVLGLSPLLKEKGVAVINAHFIGLVDAQGNVVPGPPLHMRRMQLQDTYASPMMYYPQISSVIFPELSMQNGAVAASSGDWVFPELDEPYSGYAQDLSDSGVKLVKTEMGVAAEINDVRPAGSPPLEFYLQVSVRLQDSVGLQDGEPQRSLSMHKTAAPGVTCAKQMGCGDFALSVNAHQESFFFYTGRIPAAGQLMSVKYHAKHAFQESLIFRGYPWEIGLGKPPVSPFLSQELSLEPLARDELGFPFPGYGAPPSGVGWFMDKIGMNVSVRGPRWPRMTNHPITPQSAGYASNAALKADLLKYNAAAEAAGVYSPKLICTAKHRARDPTGKVNRGAHVECAPHHFGSGEVYTVVSLQGPSEDGIIDDEEWVWQQDHWFLTYAAFDNISRYTVQFGSTVPDNLHNTTQSGKDVPAWNGAHVYMYRGFAPYSPTFFPCFLNLASRIATMPLTLGTRLIFVRPSLWGVWEYPPMAFVLCLTALISITCLAFHVIFWTRLLIPAESYCLKLSRLPARHHDTDVTRTSHVAFSFRMLMRAAVIPGAITFVPILLQQLFLYGGWGAYDLLFPLGTFGPPFLTLFGNQVMQELVVSDITVAQDIADGFVDDSESFPPWVVLPFGRVYGRLPQSIRTIVLGVTVTIVLEGAMNSLPAMSRLEPMGVPTFSVYQAIECSTRAALQSLTIHLVNVAGAWSEYYNTQGYTIRMPLSAEQKAARLRRILWAVNALLAAIYVAVFGFGTTYLASAIGGEGGKLPPWLVVLEFALTSFLLPYLTILGLARTLTPAILNGRLPTLPPAALACSGFVWGWHRKRSDRRALFFGAGSCSMYLSLYFAFATSARLPIALDDYLYFKVVFVLVMAVAMVPYIIWCAMAEASLKSGINSKASVEHQRLLDNAEDEEPIMTESGYHYDPIEDVDMPSIFFALVGFAAIVNRVASAVDFYVQTSIHGRGYWSQWFLDMYSNQGAYLLYSDQIVAVILAYWLGSRMMTGWQMQKALWGIVFFGPSFSLAYYCYHFFPRRNWEPAESTEPSPHRERVLFRLMILATAMPYIFGWSYVYDHGHYNFLDVVMDTMGDGFRGGYRTSCIEQILLVLLALGVDVLIFTNGGRAEWVSTLVVLHYSTPAAAFCVTLLADLRAWRFKTNRACRLEKALVEKFATSRRRSSNVVVAKPTDDASAAALKEKGAKLWRKVKVLGGATTREVETNLRVTILNEPWRLLGIYGALPKGNGIVFTANS